MRHSIITSCVIATIFFSGCGYKEGIATPDRMSYLYFSGNTENVLVSIDNGAQFSVMPGRDNQYQIKPGKHSIRVYKEGILVVERDVYIGDGVAKEIGVN